MQLITTTEAAKEGGKSRKELEEMVLSSLSDLFSPPSTPQEEEQQHLPSSLRLSYSSLYQYRLCPLSFYYAHVLSLPSK